MSIKEVSKLYKILPNKLRFYEKKGLIEPKRDAVNGYRIYSKHDLVRIQMILTYRILEVPVENIKALLDVPDKTMLINQVLGQLDMVNQHIHKYKIIQASLEQVIDSYVESDSKLDLESHVIDAGQAIGNTLTKINAWTDRWNFDEWAETYDVNIQEQSTGLDLFQNYEIVLNKVYHESLQGIKTGDIILDIGVGTGALASMYLAHAFEVIGVDPSRQMLLKAKEKHPSMKLRVGDFLKLPVENHTVNRIVTTYALHHLTDEEKAYALDEMLRVMKPDGKIIIGDMMFSNISAREAFIKTLSTEDKAAVEDEYYMNIEHFGGLLKAKNLSYQIEQIDSLMHIMTIFVPMH